MDLARLARMSRRRRRRHERRQKHGRAWGALRIALVGLVSDFLLCVVSFFTLFGYTYVRVAEELPELGQYSAAELAQTSVVYDSRGGRPARPSCSWTPGTSVSCRNSPRVSGSATLRSASR